LLPCPSPLLLRGEGLAPVTADYYRHSLRRPLQPCDTQMPLPEWSPGLGLGILPVLGMYFSQAGTYTLHAVIASIPSGFLVHNLLLLNEFPI